MEAENHIVLFLADPTTCTETKFSPFHSRRSDERLEENWTGSKSKFDTGITLQMHIHDVHKFGREMMP